MQNRGVTEVRSSRRLINEKRNKFQASPHYEDEVNDQVCDGVINCRDGIVLLEYKGTTFTAEAKYGGDVDLLRDEVERKLVEPKGVKQLARAITNLYGPEARKILGSKFSLPPRVFPLLVVRDDIASAFMLNTYLNKRFNSMTDCSSNQFT